ncbi:ABC transporter ATP-binding protein, partial [Burkholderia ubonensis]|uniref:ABC transporter ATP-binding protein n=1 Tax=Burkholderia ubonensis TaxID=101571 RepID=UPI000ACCAB40
TLVPTKKFSGNYDTFHSAPWANGRPEPLTQQHLEAHLECGVVASQRQRIAPRDIDAAQRVWIAMALAQRADILLLDEPTTYLDLGHQLDVMTTLRRLNEAFGLTIVMSLHDLNQAMRVADRAVVMRDGRLIADGVPIDVLRLALVADVFHVGSRTCKIMKCLSGEANRSRTGLQTIASGVARSSLALRGQH